MHSPFGWQYQVAKEFGWTMHQILWKVPRLQIRMMMADRPQMIRKKVKKGTKAQLDQMF